MIVEWLLLALLVLLWLGRVTRSMVVAISREVRRGLMGEGIWMMQNCTRKIMI